MSQWPVDVRAGAIEDQSESGDSSEARLEAKKAAAMTWLAN